MFVAADHPEAAVGEAAGARFLGVPPDRRGAAQLGELGQRQAALHHVGIDEVERAVERIGHRWSLRGVIAVSHQTIH